MRKRFLWIVFFGLLVRFGVMFLDFAWDVNNHMSWATDLWDPRRGFATFYHMISAAWFGTMYPNYPPFAMYLFYLLLPVQKVIESIVWQLNLAVPAFPSALVFFVQSRTFAAGLFKIPSIVADVALAFVLYRFAKHYVGRGSNLPLFAASAVLLNPAFFYNSAYWGQIDSIPLLFAVCSSILVINKKHPVLSALLFTTSLLFKPTTIIFLPFFAYFFYKQFGNLRTILLSAGASAAIFFFSFIPFVPIQNLIPGTITLYVNNILAAQSLKYVTNGAFNLWAIVVGLKDIPDTTTFLISASYQQWGIVLAGVWTAIVLNTSRRFNDYSYRIPYVFALTALGTFIFLTRMHERYTMLPLPFLITMAVQNKRVFPVVWILSAVSFLNLYKSWPVPRIELLLSAVSHPVGYGVLSVVTIIMAVILLQLPYEVRNSTVNRKTKRR